MTEKRAKTLPNSIKAAIIEDIMTGEIQPRDKILEEKYAKKMGASRASVREAIFMLVSEGIATKIENKGTFLNSFTYEEHIDLYHLRFFLEQQAIQKYPRIKDFSELIAELTSLSTKMKDAMRNVAELSLYNYQFHYALVEHSGSRVLIERYPSFYVSLAFIQNELYHHHRSEIEKPVNEHDELIEALKERDFDKLTEVLSTHQKDVLALLQRTVMQRLGA